MRRHLLDTPCPTDDVHTLCGERLTPRPRKTLRGEHVTGNVELVNCVGCLRAHVAKLNLEIARLTAEPTRP